MDVTTDSIVAFGTRAGRDPETIDYTVIKKAVENVSLGTGDGITDVYATTLASTPVVTGSLLVKVNSLTKDITEAAGTLSGADVDSGTLDTGTGALSINFSGTPGTVASYTSLVDLAGTPLDTTALSKDIAFNLTIDGVTTENIHTGITDASYTNADLVTTINTAVGSTVASVDVGGGVLIEGAIGSATVGEVTIAPPTDLVTYDNGIATLFDATYTTGSIVEDTASTNPTGAIPQYGQTVTVDYLYTSDVSLTVSHSFFAASPYNDDIDPIAIDVVKVTGETYQYDMYIYQVDPVRGNLLIESNRYSLIEELDTTGKQIYIHDIFDESHPYVIPVINADYAGTADPSVASPVQLTGGDEGATPLDSDYQTAWEWFQKYNKYPSKLLVDVIGNSYTYLENLVNNYQVYSHGIFPVPLGNSRADAVTYRQGLGISNDKLSIYWNWGRVKDTYNNSSAWTSLMGKVAVKYAQMVDVYDGLSPAGIDRNNHGGILSGFPILELEEDVNEVDKDLLDNAQINPIIKDGSVYRIDGDRTLITVNTDTSFVGTRRVYNYINQNVYEQVLREQVFKLNNAPNRAIKRNQVEQIVAPIRDAGIINDFRVICDETNNTPTVLDSRNFVINLYIQATPNSQFVNFYLDRFGQTVDLGAVLV